MKRTTLFADAGTLLELKRLAQEQRRPVAQLVREALEEYIQARRRPGRRLSFVGIGESKTGDLSEQVDEHLAKIYEEEFQRERRSWEEELRQRGES